MSPGQRNEPRRHHYIPRFLLRRFAENPAQDGSQVHQLDRQSGQCRRINPSNAAVIRDFYAVVDEEGTRHQDAEQLLGLVEQAAAPLIVALETPGTELRGEDRYNLAFFLATLWLRTPLWRERFQHTEEQLGEFLLRHAPPEHYQAAARAAGEEITLEEAHARREEVVAALDRRGIEVVAGHERHLAIMFEHAVSTAWILFRLDWTLLRCPDGQSLVIADEPVSTYEIEDGRATRAAFPLGSAAAEMAFPLDPTFVLLLTPNTDLLEEVAHDDGRALREITSAQVEEQLDRDVVWQELNATQQRIHDINLRSYANTQRWLYGQTQGVLTDLRHAARGADRARLSRLQPCDPGMTIVHGNRSQPPRVWQAPHRQARPRRRAR